MSCPGTEQCLGQPILRVPPQLLFSVLSSRNIHISYHAKHCLMGFLGFCNFTLHGEETGNHRPQLQPLDVECGAVSD